jgi:hypothetical protein
MAEIGTVTVPVQVKWDVSPALGEFQGFPKIARLNRSMVVTEKIDGTNAAVGVLESGAVYAQSRKNIITPGKQTDNFGFAGWVAEHADELRDGLGVGLHFGEWWGEGIQRGYGLRAINPDTGKRLPFPDRRFSLFNTARWHVDGAKFEGRPECVGVVPVLYEGPFDVTVANLIMERLDDEGSAAAPGFRPAEGIVVFHASSRQLFKATILDDDVPKSAPKEDA